MQLLVNALPDPRPALELGLAVFPLPPESKAPPPPGWQRDATTAPAAWPPGSNIGVACWRSGVVVLDLDVPGPGHRTRAHGQATLAAACAVRGRPWPRTLTVATPSGGRHLYFRAPAGVVIGSTSGGTSGLGEGIDTRGPGAGGRGGYVVGPGSVIGGRRYEVIDPAPIAELPGWIAGVLGRPRRAVP